MPNGKPVITFIGFGEAGQAIAAGLRETGVERMAAWDILFPTPRATGCGRPERQAACVALFLLRMLSRSADLIISAVTAASSVEAARSVKPHLAGKPYFLDINSVSPGRKQETAKLLGDAARYVDVAVLAPIHPARHQTPMLLAGAHAETVAPVLAGLGMRASYRRRGDRRGGGDQDGAQRDDQGHRGADARMLSGRGARRRRR